MYFKGVWQINIQRIINFHFNIDLRFNLSH
jgi:hypothetical protein